MKSKLIWTVVAVVVLGAVIVIGRKASGPGPEATESPTASPTESPAAEAVAPKITGFAPTSGGPGTSVVIIGSGFSGVTSVTIGNVAAAITAKSDSSLTVTVPGSVVTGRVRVTTSEGTAVSADAFTVTTASPSPTPTPTPTPTSSPTPSPTPGAEAMLGFSASAYSVVEDQLVVTITVTRTVSTEGTVSVTYDTSGISAEANDFVHTAGLLTFDAGIAERSFTVRIMDDNQVEGDETVNLSLSNPSVGAVLGTSTAVLTIVDDETQTY